MSADMVVFVILMGGLLLFLTFRASLAFARYFYLGVGVTLGVSVLAGFVCGVLIVLFVLAILVSHA